MSCAGIATPGDRDYDTIEKTILGPAVTLPGIVPAGSQAAAFTVGPNQVVDLIGGLREPGIDHFIFGATIEYPDIVDFVASQSTPHVAKQPAAG